MGSNPNDLVDTLLARTAPRAGSLIITVFGDAIAPRSHDVWLGSLITMMAELGLSERLVRTGVYRLASDGWLHSRSRGRKSFYALTDTGRTTFAEAEARIYASAPRAWDGHWTLIQGLPGMSAGQRKKMRDALRWRGYGQLSPTLMIKPQRRDPAHALSDLGEAAPRRLAVIYTASQHELAVTASLRETAQVAWDLAGLNAAYESFIKCFSPAGAAVPDDPPRAFALRSLLIHEFRRILLQDPQLPEAMLPPDWAGSRARELAGSIYRALRDPAEAYISRTLENWDGAIQPPNPAAMRRFA